jgi:hypothetical protein
LSDEATTRTRLALCRLLMPMCFAFVTCGRCGKGRWREAVGWWSVCSCSSRAHVQQCECECGAAAFCHFPLLCGFGDGFVSAVTPRKCQQRGCPPWPLLAMKTGCGHGTAVSTQIRPGVSSSWGPSLGSGPVRLGPVYGIFALVRFPSPSSLFRMSSKIYFAGSIRGGREDAEIYKYVSWFGGLGKQGVPHVCPPTKGTFMWQWQWWQRWQWQWSC